MGLPTPLGAIDRPIRETIRRLDRILTSIETLAVSIKAIEREMTGMRGDVQALGNRVDALRGDVQGLDKSVVGIRDATESLEGAVGGLEEHLEGVGSTLRRVDAIVPRLGRRSRAAAAPHRTPAD